MENPPRPIMAARNIRNSIISFSLDFVWTSSLRRMGWMGFMESKSKIPDRIRRELARYFQTALAHATRLSLVFTVPQRLGLWHGRGFFKYRSSMHVRHIQHECNPFDMGRITPVF